MAEPVERELMPGVFVTDFRNSSSAAISAQANEAAAALATVAAVTTAAESKSKEQAEADDNEDADDAAAAAAAPATGGGAAAAGSSSRSFTAAVPRPANAVFPRDIPNDVEELELELAALEKNMAQLIKSNAVLLEELKEDPEEQVRESANKRCSPTPRAWAASIVHARHSVATRPFVSCCCVCVCVCV